MAKTAPTKADSSANLGFESRGGGIWLTADKLPNNMDAAEYKHVVLGLIFLKYISDTNPLRTLLARLLTRHRPEWPRVLKRICGASSIAAPCLQMYQSANENLPFRVESKGKSQ